jgi:hypothetical protein
MPTLRLQHLVALSLVSVTLLASPAQAADSGTESDAMSRCLSAWGTHPFGPNPGYRTLATSVKVFGIGDDTRDTTPTARPELVMVNPGVNVMGGAAMELLNPNGWYCLRSNVNVMGGLVIRAHCQAHLASAVEGVTVLGTNQDGQAVTVMGNTQVERVGCERS